MNTIDIIYRMLTTHVLHIKQQCLLIVIVKTMTKGSGMHGFFRESCRQNV